MKAQLFTYDHKLTLEAGGYLSRFQIAYHIDGVLNQERDNVIWVCHGLTANSEVSDWWEGIYGVGKALDPSKYLIICANVLGSCYGSTNALSIDPETSKPYYHHFPEITIKDMVGALDLLRQDLGFEKIHTLIGGSLGGQQVIEWAAWKPDLFQKIVPIAANAWHSPWGIAFNETQRMAIELDPTWSGEGENAGINGLKTARATALLSYRHYKTYAQTQREQVNDIKKDYNASSYQRYQGEKLAKRFNAYTYWHLSKAMDSHHIGRGRKSAKEALRNITMESLVIGINSDVLFPTCEQVYLFNHLPNAHLSLIDSNFGHDGFLTETKKLNTLLLDFIERRPKETTKIPLAVSA